jgi:ABC-2 type transport system ATP-binding protein
MPAIEVHDLTKRFGALIAVERLSFEVDAGQVVGFLGPNGAGKTTTLRILLGLAAATSGTATINGKPYRDLDRPLQQVGAVLDGMGAHPGRSARNHLRIQAMTADLDPSRVDEVLELVDLTSAADRRVGAFSLGMRQRLGLASALLCNPEILILDEPANGLDPEGIRWLRRLLRRLADEGRTVLVSSHVLAEIAQTVDSVVIVARGRLVTNSTIDELVARATRVVHVHTPKATELQTALEAEGIRVADVSRERLDVRGASVERIMSVAAELAIPITEATTQAADLEDIFLELTAEHEGAGVLR